MARYKNFMNKIYISLDTNQRKQIKELLTK